MNIENLAVFSDIQDDQKGDMENTFPSSIHSPDSIECHQNVLRSGGDIIEVTKMLYILFLSFVFSQVLKNKYKIPFVSTPPIVNRIIRV